MAGLESLSKIFTGLPHPPAGMPTAKIISERQVIDFYQLFF
jgi:hypothetical protein